METNCNDPSEISDDEMFSPRQVGVRRTQRRKIILSLVVLACVIGFWQFVREDDGIIRLEETYHGLNNLRVAMASNNIEYRPIPDGASDEHNGGQGPSGNLSKTTNATRMRITNHRRRETSTLGGGVKRSNKTNNYIDYSTNETHSHPDDTRNPLQSENDSRDSKENTSALQQNLTVDETTKTMTGEVILKDDQIRNETNDITAKMTTKYGTNTTFNYSHPRYSTTKEGQFNFVKFINDSALARNSRAGGLSASPFEETDRARLTILSEGQFREIYSIQHHEHLRLVAFDAPTIFHGIVPIEACPTCATIKTKKDINEVLAFHVDRTLGVGRALPVSARKFQSIELENLEFNLDQVNDTLPVMWFASDLIHGGSFQPDQNSVQLTWRQYQEVLRDCQRPNTTHMTNCTDIEYSDWSRMAVLDFVMQNHDRLDRYCCGFEGLTESCYETREEIYDCDDIDNRFLVHILTSKTDPGHLVLLDNAGNLGISEIQLNYEILTGIRTIPQEILLNINSDDFGARLMKSLQWDPVYTEIVAGDELRRLVGTITQRVKKLKQYIEEHNITQLDTKSEGTTL